MIEVESGINSRVFLSAFLCIMPFASMAAEPNSSLKKTDTLILRADNFPDPKRLAEISAQFGLKTPYQSSKNIKLSDVVIERCGSFEGDYLYAIQLTNPSQTISKDTILKPEETLNLPPCLPSRNLEVIPVTVQSGDTLWKFYQSYFQTGNASIPFVAKAADGNKRDNFKPENTQIKIPKARPSNNEAPDTHITIQIGNGGLANPIDGSPSLNSEIATELTAGKSFVDIIKSINPTLSAPDKLMQGSEIKILKSRRSTFEMPLSPQGAEEIEKLNQGAGAFFTAKLNTKIASASFSNGYEFFSSVNSDKCHTNEPKWTLGQRNEILKILIENLSLIRTDRPQRPNIVILDTGIYSPANLPGKPAVSILDEKTDLLLGDLPRPRATISYEPYSRMTQAAHGTQVASITTRGVVDANLAALVGYRFSIQPVRIFNEKVADAVDPVTGMLMPTQDGNVAQSVTHIFDSDIISSSIRRADRAIVNLSFGRDVEIEEIRLKNRKDGSTLFVVAAGNSSKQLDFEDIYPGRTGGEDSPAVITVASVDYNNKLSHFSNYSTKYVDIAAPGCGVLTRSFDPTQQRYFSTDSTGTSFSAPHVSWVAAILRAIMPEKAAYVLKVRILAGADIVPELADQVSEGRVLNPIKSLSLTLDVVEIIQESGERKIHRAKITDGDRRSIHKYCNKAPAIDKFTLLKVVTGFDGIRLNERVNRLYFLDNKSGVLRAQNCSARAFSLTLSKGDDFSDFSIEGSRVKDLVFSWKQ